MNYRATALSATATFALCALVAPATASAGIKYWDNPDYKAFDVGDYAPGAVWNYDGIRNDGLNEPHSTTTTTWKNLGSSGANNDVWVRYQKAGGGWSTSAPASLEPVGGKNPGSWTANGFTFMGDSEWRSAGSIDTGTNYTIQALVTAKVSEQKYSWIYLMSVQKDHFAFAMDKSAGKLYWKTQDATIANHPFISGDDLGYMTAILNGTDKTATFFSGTTIPTSGDDGFRQFSSVSGKSDNGYCICGYTGNDCMFVGTIHSYRYYKRVLTEEELVWNRVVDERRFFDRYAPLPVTNVVIATSVAGATGAEPCGTYAVDSRHLFTAPATVTISGTDYVCTGYTIEARDGDGWATPAFHKAALYQPVAFVATDADYIRLTWQWAKANGLKNLYTVDDYVWDDLNVFYDGICNAGTNLPHSYTATTWVNLGTTGSVNNVFIQRLNTASNSWANATSLDPVNGLLDPGYWTANGFVLDAKSRFRCNSPGGFAVGTSYSLQMLIDAKASDQTTSYAYPFCLNSDDFAFRFTKGIEKLEWMVGGTTYSKPYLAGDTYDYLTAIMKDDGDNDTQTFFSGTTIPTSGSGYTTGPAVAKTEKGFCLAGFGSGDVKYRFVGTLKNFRQYNRALTQAEVTRNRKVDDWRYFGIPDVTNVIVQSTVPYLRGDEPDGPYAVDVSHTFTAPTTVTAKGIEYACDGYTVETWNDGAWSDSVSSSSSSYAYNTSYGLVRLTWRWQPVRGLRTAANYSFADYSQAGLYWHYDGLLNQGVGKARSTAADAKWINLGSAGATYDLSKYRANTSTPDGEWTTDGYLFRGGTRYRASGVPIGPFKSFSIQALVDANMANQPAGKACYIVSGIWDYFAMALGNNDEAYIGTLYGNFQGLGSGNKHATVYFKNDSGHYDFATSIMDYDAKTAQVFGGVEPPTSGTGFHQFDSVTSRNDTGFGLGNSGGNGTEALVGTLKSFRYYDRVLTQEEIVRNRNVDAVRYFGELGVTNVVVEVAEGETYACDPAPDAYFVEGSYDFTASGATGCKVQVRNGNDWQTVSRNDGDTFHYPADLPEGATEVTIVWSKTNPFVIVVR